MRRQLGLVTPLAVLGLALASATAQVPPSSRDDEQPIRKLVDRYGAAFNKGDPDALLSFWADDADYVDDGGKVYKGRSALLGLFKEHLAKLKGYQLGCKITSLRFMGADVALLDGTAVLSSADGASRSCRYTGVLSKTSGQWLISRVRDLPSEDEVTGSAAASQLQQLEWLVGEWAHEDKSVMVRVSCRWAMNKNFLVQDCVAKPKDGAELAVTQWIGWDPSAGQLRSWFFDSRGGYGDGAWVPAGKTWSVEVAGVLADGRSGSSIYRWQFMDHDTYLWQARERQVDGEPVPDVELKFVHKPAVPDLDPPPHKPSGPRPGAPPVHVSPPAGVRPGFVPTYRPPASSGVRPVVPAHPRPVYTPGYRPGATVVTPPRVSPGRGYPVARPAYPWGSRPVVNVRPTYRPVYAYHQAWHHGYWPYWHSHPVVWVGSGAALGWLLAPGETYVYSNPYYVPPATVVVPVYNYAQPLPAPPPPVPALTEAAPVPEPQTAPADVMAAFEAARAAFKEGAYQKALELADKAITRLSSDAVLHEFRALTLFALGNYRDAAAALYAVLAAGPGWDWETMRSCYPDVKTYTDQLRALEAYQKSHPNAPEASFLLAYHYLTLGYPEQASKQLEHVVALRPDDKLSAQLLQVLTQKRTDQPAPQP